MSTLSNNSGKPARLPVDGLLLLNKPAGLTSNRALQKVRRLLQARKAGHTGSLDPAATGMLPLCFGEATKVCAYLLNADKTYRVTVRLGEKTDTGDADGQVIEAASVPEMTEPEWQEVLVNFVGETEQIPPMYSALKVDGKRLYELARKGEVVERKPRTIRVDELLLLEGKGSRLVLRVKCSKGTYIRTLVEDIAVAAGTIAHTVSLHRESVGAFRAQDMLDLSKAEEWAETAPQLLRERLLAPDIALLDMPAVEISEQQVTQFVQGQMLDLPGTGNGEVRVYGAKTHFVGVGALIGDGRLAPRRVFNMQKILKI
jgi:tRNA pseudouridine55 synthase